MAAAGTPSKGKQLKELLHAPKILIAPGVYDGYSVRLLEKLGFKSGSISGAGVSESHLGWADRGVMNYGDNVATARQLAAILASPDRRPGLGQVAVPTLVVHGDADPLVTLPGGVATAEAVPDAELWVIEGMGHDLPQAVVPELCTRLVALTGGA